MADELTHAERAELEQLRAEKAAKLKAEQAARERAELKQLKAERAQRADDLIAIEHEAKLRERGRKLMQPDADDLKMPLGQKIALGLMALIVVVLVASHFLR